MKIKDVINLLNEKGEVNLDIWKPLSARKSSDGTLDILYRNLVVGSDSDPVFLWVYVNVLEDDVRVLEKITFKKEHIRWITNSISKFEKT
ncbi:MAG: hypothetical protein PWP49_829 [Thermococcaceae archaeon]|uniref:hypothetical protein n=1 Tax=Thermococcus TaxID=2263 RepID=UPI0005B2AA49|nr:MULTISPECIES: hypothetical protein [Thermococcus]KUJ99627.1 MAG: Uncharacterized protein XD43_0701 [Thermococcales archaeon 44_46]MDN5320409.1 hypothetical protein [Thermococcaceae archaeon]MPW39993.1 hypothetical protein [Thermococcus sp. 101 C5]MCA6212844.1 hypothetical protein [Thermococcus bergensis]HIH71824.1 hypothetical protein [Thermococcaceae archaeon]